MSKKQHLLHRVLSVLIVLALTLSFQPLSVLAQAPNPAKPQGPQNSAGNFSMPAATSWDGIGNISNLESVVPPDVNGDVGPDHYVQIVNNLFMIWNKVGVPLFFGAQPVNELFNGFGGLCESSPGNGAIVLYDHLADRWVITYPAYGAGRYLQCVAVTKTPDPVYDPSVTTADSKWYRYSFLISTTRINDHPKLALWPDGYYLSFDELNPATKAFMGAGIAVFEREKMLDGQTPGYYFADLSQSFPTGNLHNMLFADLDGAPPPAGTSAYLAQIFDKSGNNDQMEILRVFPDWIAGSLWVGNGQFIAVSSFNSTLCGGAVCIPQPDTTQMLDPLTDGLMNRLQYRYQDGNGYLVTNQTVNMGGDQAGIRWYQFTTSDNSNWSVTDSGNFAPDAADRWNGSAAMDASGNIAVGYSVSGGSVYPSIRYAGRLAGDAAGTLGQGDAALFDGTGSQTDSSGAWGNYSSMSVDPTDQCTFWYTNEYISNTGLQTWKTRIGKFSYGIGNCETPATYSISGIVTNKDTDAPIPNAIVKTNTGFVTFTEPDGTYVLEGLPAGTVTVIADANQYFDSSKNITVPIGSDVDFQLSSAVVNIDFETPVTLTGARAFDLLHGWTVSQYVRTVGDVNKDGKADLIGFGLDGVYVALSKTVGLGFEPISRWTTSFDSSHGWTVKDHVRTVGDVNGDGYADLVGFGLDGVYVALSTGSGFGPVSRWTTSFDLSHGWTVKDYARTVGDVNGDGYADLVGFGLDGVYVALSTGSGFDPISRWTTSFDLSHGWTVSQYARTVGDVNGDGYADLVGFGLDGVYVALSTGSGFGPISKRTSSFDLSHGWTVKDYVRTVGDVNGDNKDDLVGFGLDGVYGMLSNGINFEPISRWTSSFDLSHSWTVKDYVRTVGDIDGDGRADLVGFGLDGVYIGFSR